MRRRERYRMLQRQGVRRGDVVILTVPDRMPVDSIVRMRDDLVPVTKRTGVDFVLVNASSAPVVARGPR